MAIFDVLKRLKEKFKLRLQDKPVPLGYVLTDEQINNATVWLINHAEYMVGLTHTDDFLEPTEDIADNPELWNFLHWSWFFKAVNKMEKED